MTTYTSELNQPWGMVFLPNGDLLVTEKKGIINRISHKSPNKKKVITGVPKVFNRGQGGLLDIAIDPDFSQNKNIYFSYAEPSSMGVAGTAVAKAKLVNNQLFNLKVIWRQKPKVAGTAHWGSRLVFASDKTLFITTGERYSFKEKAQSLDNHFGKIIRINTDGSIPSDNPYVNDKAKLSDIWSYGHRNIQGAYLDPQTGELWTHEHGPKGGDEINISKAGYNYGWPVITYGVGYMGEKIGIGTQKQGMQQPIHYWTPSIAPSGLLIYTGDKFPKWKNNFFVGSLKFRYLIRLVIENGKVTKEEKLLSDLKERIRDVDQDKAGNIYVLTDSTDGRIIKLSP